MKFSWLPCTSWSLQSLNFFWKRFSNYHFNFFIATFGGSIPQWFKESPNVVWVFVSFYWFTNWPYMISQQSKSTWSMTQCFWATINTRKTIVTILSFSTHFSNHLINGFDSLSQYADEFAFPISSIKHIVSMLTILSATVSASAHSERCANIISICHMAIRLSDRKEANATVAVAVVAPGIFVCSCHLRFLAQRWASVRGFFISSKSQSVVGVTTELSKLTYK